MTDYVYREALLGWLRVIAAELALVPRGHWTADQAKVFNTLAIWCGELLHDNREHGTAADYVDGIAALRARVQNARQPDNIWEDLDMKRASYSAMRWLEDILEARGLTTQP